MIEAPAPDPRWLRAAVLGSLWAALEIVLGSFLHNLRVPLRGHVMTFLAIALLVAGHRVWPQPGLLWRTGLVAAAMKSVSPSAVLLGPMLAIVAEGFALEAGVALLGRRRAGFTLGGALAMSWTFLHQVASLLVTYGANFARLYAGAVRAAEKVVGTVPLGPWGPLAALAGLNAVLGAAAALVGWTVGTAPAATAPQPALAVLPARRQEFGGAHRSTSLAWLAALVVLLPLGLLGLGRLPLPGSAAVTAVVVTACAVRYRDAARRLARPGLWLSLTVTTVAAGLVLGDPTDRLAGVLLGLAMCVRALFVTACFVGISRELSNPRLQARLGARGAGSLLVALEAGFASLPEVIAALPPARAFLRAPRAALASLLPRLDGWLEAASARAASNPPFHVLAGARGAGKSTLVGQVVERLRDAGFEVGGVWAPGSLEDGVRSGFEAVDLATGARATLAHRNGPATWASVGPFRFSPDGLTLARRALAPDAARSQDLTVVDEVGPWELAGEGYARELDALRAARVPLCVVVRDELLGAVVQRWAALRPTVWRLGHCSAEEVADGIAASLRRAAPTSR